MLLCLLTACTHKMGHSLSRLFRRPLEDLSTESLLHLVALQDFPLKESFSQAVQNVSMFDDDLVGSGVSFVQQAADLIIDGLRGLL